MRREFARGGGPGEGQMYTMLCTSGRLGRDFRRLPDPRTSGPSGDNDNNLLLAAGLSR